MARLPYVEADSDVAQRIRQRRGGTLRPLDGMLLHSPPAADGWNAFIGALRNELDLPADVRELVILRIAVLNNAPYEWQAHRIPGLDAGLSEQQLSAVLAAAPFEAASSPVFAGQLRLALTYVDELTVRGRVSDDLFASVSRGFSPRELVELTLVVSAYNMVSRFLNALDVGESANDMVGAAS